MSQFRSPRNALCPPQGESCGAGETASEVVEFHGAETSVTVSLGADTVVLVLRGDAPEPGSEVSIVAELDRLHVLGAGQA